MEAPGLLACPLCRSPLASLDARTFGCEAGHRYDRARDGSLDLLRPGKVRKATSGDDAEMVRARRAVLGRGRYAVLADGLAAIAGDLAPATVVDAGCGEGSFTERLCGPGRAVVAFDLSKPAVRMAARLLGDRATCVVASVLDVPVLDGAADLVASVMSPVHDELLRVARPGGHVLVVAPGARHLDGLRALLYDEPRPHDEEVPLAGRLAEVRRERLTATVDLAAEEAELVWAMTPYRWSAPVEGVQRLRAAGGVTTTVDFLAVVSRAPGGDGR